MTFPSSGWVNNKSIIPLIFLWSKTNNLPEISISSLYDYLKLNKISSKMHIVHTLYNNTYTLKLREDTHEKCVF